MQVADLAARSVQIAPVMRNQIMTKVILASSIFVSGALLGGCSKSKKQDTTPAPVESIQDPAQTGQIPVADSPAPVGDTPITGDNVFFAFDSSELTVAGRASLDEVITWVKADKERTILIRGHADKSGETDYNLDLSARRAQAVGAYVKSQGVADKQIILAAVGEALADKDPAAANRRVVIYSTVVKSSMNNK
jgi:OmpA-OmpF porin, OOP family